MILSRFFALSVSLIQKASPFQFFMFDWYWYAETGNPAPRPGPGGNRGYPKTEQGGPFLEAALNAFVAAPNTKRLKFCLHFCNQDWVDVSCAATI